MTADGAQRLTAKMISAWNSVTCAQRRSPSGWFRMINSLRPSVAAASWSSRARTRPRSAFWTGLLNPPSSPCDAHRSTTRTPASDSRASVPPQASDSSSGWAKMARTVRPLRTDPLAGDRSMMRLHELLVRGHVLVHHAVRPEASSGVFANSPAVEVEHAAQPVGHLLQILEDHSRDPVVNDFANRAAIEGRDWRSTRHGLGQDETERLRRLNRVEQRACAAVQLDLCRMVGLAVINDETAIHVRGHFLAVVAVFGRREDEPHAHTLGQLDGLKDALACGEPAQKQQVVVWRFTKLKASDVDAVQHRA